MMNDLISYHEKILEKTKLKYALEDFRAVRAKVLSQIGGVVGEVKPKFTMGSRNVSYNIKWHQQHFY